MDRITKFTTTDEISEQLSNYYAYCEVVSFMMLNAQKTLALALISVMSQNTWCKTFFSALAN